MVEYIPEIGDLVILTFNPQSGHEQKGRRPALIVSNKVFNKHLGLAFACPITNIKRDFPFHVEVRSEKLTGYIIMTLPHKHSPGKSNINTKYNSKHTHRYHRFLSSG